jgi:pre-mRNA-splicing factor CWC22
MIEVLFQIRKEKFKDNVAIPTELDLVEEEDQITHYVMLDDELDTQDGTNIFKFDDEFIQHEDEYDAIKMEILGNEEDEEEEDDDAVSSDEEDKSAIHDKTDTNLINFRKIVYLTIMSSLDFEECGHKILKMNMPPDFEIELCHMIVECSSNERNYLKFFGLLAERFCKIDPIWRENFERCFVEVYSTAHRLETNKIRNVSKLFGHLFESDAITWAVLECVRLTEEDTTAAGRIFIKFLFQDLAEFYGIPKLYERLSEADFRPYFEGIFPSDDAAHLRFSVNYFTAIGLGGLTEEMRDRLKIIQSSLIDTSKPTVLAQTRRAIEPPSPPSSRRYNSRSPRYRSRSPRYRERERERERY